MTEINFSDLLAGFMGEVPEPISYSENPEPERYMAALDLFHDHQRRLDEAQHSTETAMLTPRITIREHVDMHTMMHAMDTMFRKEADDLYTAIAAYGMGSNINGLEDLQFKSREITEAAKLRHELNRIHNAWADERESEANEADERMNLED
jgi:hypothetical protein